MRLKNYFVLFHLAWICVDVVAEIWMCLIMGCCLGPHWRWYRTFRLVTVLPFENIKTSEFPGASRWRVVDVRCVPELRFRPHLKSCAPNDCTGDTTRVRLGSALRVTQGHWPRTHWHGDISPNGLPRVSLPLNLYVTSIPPGLSLRDSLLHCHLLTLFHTCSSVGPVLHTC